MKMRDKKKVNRIVKAGLALLCAGALLGGAVFYGGSVRVKAEGEDDKTVDVKAVYHDDNDENSYILYDDSENIDLVVKSQSGSQYMTETLSDEDRGIVDTNVYIIWDARVLSDESTDDIPDRETVQKNISNFSKECPHSISWIDQDDGNSLNLKLCILPQQSIDNIEFNDIEGELNSYDARMKSDDNGTTITDGQLQASIEALENKIDDKDCNIVVIITDQSGYNTNGLDEKQAIVYKVCEGSNLESDVDVIPYTGWENSIFDKISTLDLIKMYGNIRKYEGVYYDGNNVIEFFAKKKENPSVGIKPLPDLTTSEVTTEGAGNTEDVTEKTSENNDSDTVTYEILTEKTEIRSSQINIYIRSSNDNDDLEDGDVTVSLEGETFKIQKDPQYKDKNVTKWIVEGNFERMATATDASDISLVADVKGQKLDLGVKKAGIVDRFVTWFNEKLSHKILLICGCLIFIILVVFIIITIRISKKRKQGNKTRQNGMPHGAPSSSPDVQLRSGVSPTAETNVLARRAGEQNMQAMQGQIPANNTMQVQLQIIGRNPKIINTYINGSIFVGRANTCDVFINDATISRQHFALECVNGEMFIQPLVATNGTKLNGQRINDKHQLYPNDRIQIGTVGIVVRW